MEKNPAPQGARPSLRSTRNRQLFIARFFLLALFLAFSVMSLQPQTSAQAAAAKWRGGKLGLAGGRARASAPDCQGDCDHAYMQCVLNGGGMCDAQYLNCVQSCP